MKKNSLTLIICVLITNLIYSQISLPEHACDDSETHETVKKGRNRSMLSDVRINSDTKYCLKRINDYAFSLEFDLDFIIYLQEFDLINNGYFFYHSSTSSSPGIFDPKLLYYYFCLIPIFHFDIFNACENSDCSYYNDLSINPTCRSSANCSAFAKLEISNYNDYIFQNQRSHNNGTLITNTSCDIVSPITEVRNSSSILPYSTIINGNRVFLTPYSGTFKFRIYVQSLNTPICCNYIQLVMSTINRSTNSTIEYFFQPNPYGRSCDLSPKKT